MEEVWKDIEGYEGLYQASTHGRIRSVNRIIYTTDNKIREQPGKILSPGKNNRGYYNVVLYKNKKAKTIFIHRLIATTFIENTYNKVWINHIDGVKANNKISNLEFSTISENIKHAFKNGLNKPNRAMVGRFGRLSPVSRSIHQFSISGEYIASYESITEAMIINGFKGHGISDSAKGKKKTSNGYIWKYTDDKQLKEAV
jgi:hypothetical protein